MSLRFDVITLFPAVFPGPLSESIPGRALARGLAQLVAHDLREWGLGRHRSVDDYPYGGGAGMVLRPEPIAAALEALDPRVAAAQDLGEGPPTTDGPPAGDGQPRARRVLLDPGGRRFDQALARELAAETHVVLVCPRYEGVDDRVRALVDDEVSIGDYVLSGGELPALVIIDAVLRLLPGAIDEASPVEESFSEGLLEYPQFTRPAEFGGVRVPDVLVSGHHAEVARWRAEQSLARTRRVRPDLLDAAAGWYTPPPTPRQSPRRSAARGPTPNPTPEVDSE